MERFHAIRGSVMRQEELKKMVKEGSVKSLNRTKEEILRSKVEKGGLTVSNWYMKDMTTATMSCQPTPGGVLARRLKEVINRHTKTRRVLITEDGGLPITSSLRRTDPFKKSECRFKDPTCMVETNKDCAKTGVLYEITCKTCNMKVHDPLKSRAAETTTLTRHVRCLTGT